MVETYVITNLCDLQCEGECLSVCPVDAIHGPMRFEDVALVPHEDRASRFAGLQMYIDPEACIFCAACEEAFPSRAIFDNDNLPAGREHERARNAAFFVAR
jgi:ferredoxin